MYYLFNKASQFNRSHWLVSMKLKVKDICNVPKKVSGTE